MIAAMRAGFEAGINWVDTAEAYGAGRSEELVAKAIEGYDDRRAGADFLPPPGVAPRRGRLHYVLEEARAGRVRVTVAQAHDHGIELARIGAADLEASSWATRGARWRENRAARKRTICTAVLPTRSSPDQIRHDTGPYDRSLTIVRNPAAAANKPAAQRPRPRLTIIILG
jgi:hypothetical protein